MPHAPKICNTPHCPNLQPCPDHPPKQYRSPSSKVTGRRDWRKIRQRILKRDRNTCHWCGKHATQVDHKTPVSHGGTNHTSNLVAACAQCNNSRTT